VLCPDDPDRPDEPLEPAEPEEPLVPVSPKNLIEITPSASRGRSVGCNSRYLPKGISLSSPAVKLNSAMVKTPAVLFTTCAPDTDILYLLHITLLPGGLNPPGQHNFN
jgi:hypothetical protein